MTNAPQVSVLFVCMGNICRSPMAECLFRHHAASRNLIDQFHIDSAGTGGWHRGQQPDDRMRSTAALKGVVVDGSARQIDTEDLNHFHHVLCMDQSNYNDVIDLGHGTAKIALMLEHHPGPVRDVPDPYYGGDDGFQEVFDLLNVAIQHLLEHLVESHGLDP